jgi:release factor glutamine methyltransferase
MHSTFTLTQAMAQLRTQGLDRLDAQMLTLHTLGRGTNDRAWLLTHDTDPMPPDALAALQALAKRRLAGEPMAYLTGHKEFYGLDLAVDHRVLDPRADTETLVDWALEVMDGLQLAPAGAGAPSALPAAKDAPPALIDLGTGSGAIALALQHNRPAWRVHALDFSADALAVARTNAERLALPVQFHQGSWLAGLEGRFTLIVSNPPYIAKDDQHLAALTHEPLQALASGDDGLDDIRSIIQQAPGHLLPGGWLLLEHGYDQAEAVCALLADAGFGRVQSRRDLADIERCSGGQWIAPPNP